MQPQDLKQKELHRSIIKWFIDEPNERCPFSIHQLTEIGKVFKTPYEDVLCCFDSVGGCFHVSALYERVLRNVWFLKYRKKHNKQL